MNIMRDPQAAYMDADMMRSPRYLRDYKTGVHRDHQGYLGNGALRMLRDPFSRNVLCGHSSSENAAGHLC